MLPCLKSENRSEIIHSVIIRLNDHYNIGTAIPVLPQFNEDSMPEGVSWEFIPKSPTDFPPLFPRWLKMMITSKAFCDVEVQALNYPAEFDNAELLVTYCSLDFMPLNRIILLCEANNYYNIIANAGAGLPFMRYELISNAKPVEFKIEYHIKQFTIHYSLFTP